MAKKKNLFTCDDNLAFNFFDNTSTSSLNKNNFPQELFQVVSLFVEDSNAHLKECYTMIERLFISGYYKGSKNELMLRYRYKDYGKIGLVVARIGFIHKRQGYMTKLYEVLKTIKRRYHYNFICIEQVHTEEMRAWCRKNGFIEMDKNMWYDTDPGSDNQESLFDRIRI